ncbi:porin PorA family protein [Gordonia malaquae]|uniref:porin PorA family protein n=1 Tax=Gordonia malaquae TaxID=410332 RepID=UPI0030C79057
MAETPTPRWTTRDLLAPTAFFLGALLVAAAIALGPVVGDRFRAVRLDIDATWVADGADGSRVLDRCSLDRPTARVLDAQVQQRRRIVAVRPSDADVVTLQAGTSLGVDHYIVDGKSVKAKDVCEEQTLAATIDRVTIDRMTALPTGDASEIQFDDKKGAVSIPDRTGFTYLLPYDFELTFPRYFDVTTRRSVPLAHSGNETVDGRNTAHFTATVSDTDLSQFDTRAVVTRPASWFGTFRGVAPDEPLTATLHHSSVRDLYVDVATGVIVDERVHISEEFRFTPALASRSRELRDFRLVNIESTLIGDRQSRQDAAGAAAARQRPVTLVTVVLPIVLGVLGVGAIAAGVVISRRSARS